MTLLANCSLCYGSQSAQSVIYSNELYRVILVDEPDYLGYVRLIHQGHIKEMTELSKEAALKIFNVLLIIEQLMRDELAPDKINIASLGNIVAHVHWHIIPRFEHDKHFPNPIWGGVTNSSYIPHPALASKIPNFIMNLKQHLLLYDKDNN